MLTNDELRRLGVHGRTGVRQPGLLTRIAGAAIGAVVLAGAFMVSVVMLAFVAAAGLAGGLYLWWKTRELRRQLRERSLNQPPPGGRVIEGEVIRESEPGQRY